MKKSVWFAVTFVSHHSLVKRTLCPFLSYCCLWVNWNLLLWGIFFARRWPFSHRGAQLLGSSIYNAAPPSSQTSNAWNTRTSSHKCFFWTLLLFQFPLNRNSGLQCPVGSEIPSGLGLVLASFSSLMIADEGLEILTWSVPEKLLRKSEWFNIIVNKCTTPELRHKLNFCSN